jgi:predicted nucleic acid-binding protein
VQLVADASRLLSAVVGGRAALVLRDPGVEEVFTPSGTYDEAFEYLAALAGKERLRLDTLLLALAALPVTVVERPVYKKHLVEARQQIARRDPDAVDVLALALELKVAVWSDDSDFSGTGVDGQTTAEVLKMLGIRST